MNCDVKYTEWFKTTFRLVFPPFLKNTNESTKSESANITVPIFIHKSLGIISGVGAPARIGNQPKAFTALRAKVTVNIVTTE